ncbi:aminotransferase class V-fold PLP-dependent enzyme, partial [candidate division KSB1 bacterium]
MKKHLSRRSFITKTFAGGILSPFLINELTQNSYDYPEKALNKDEIHLLRDGNAEDEKYWKMVRMQFPLTFDRYYFNTSGLGPSPRIVIDTVTEWTYKLETICETGHGDVHKVNEKAAKLLNADPEEIAVTRNTTEGMNIVVRSLPLQKGDEVILTSHEHPGGSIPWLALMKEIGIKIKLIEPDLTGESNLEIIEKNITKKTRVVSIDHIPCTTGMIFPAKEIVQLCRSKNIFTCFDGAHPPGMMPVDLKDIDPDFYATSGHKWLFGL